MYYGLAKIGNENLSTSSGQLSVYFLLKSLHFASKIVTQSLYKNCIVLQLEKLSSVIEGCGSCQT